MKRREFLEIAGGALAWPLTAHAQQAMPLIGFFNSGRAPTQVKNLAAFREGLKEAGFVEGRNVTIEFQWGENQFDKLPALAADVIARRPVLIVGNTLPARAAQAATSTIPIVFTTGSDPVRDGLVATLNRPGTTIGNWQWRFTEVQLLGLEKNRRATLHRWIELYDRTGDRVLPDYSEPPLRAAEELNG